MKTIEQTITIEPISFEDFERSEQEFFHNQLTTDAII
jgi:hypothetical protein